MKIVALVAALLTVAAAEDCPNLSVVQAFNSEKFAGTWYQQGSLSNRFTRCPKSEFAVMSSDSIKIRNMEQDFGHWWTVDGTAVFADPSKNEAKLVVTEENSSGSTTSDLWILATDYDNYAITFSCQLESGYPIRSAWIYTRKQILHRDDQEYIDKLLDQAFETISSEGGPEKDDFWPARQYHCPQ